MALVGQAIIDRDLSGLKEEMTETLRNAIKHETSTYFGKSFDTILLEMEEILNTQKKAVVSAANQFITKAVADVESRFELKYGKRIKELEEKLELMVAMQNPNFGRF